MRNAALCLLFMMVMARAAMAQGDIAPVQTPTFAQGLTAASSLPASAPSPGGNATGAETVPVQAPPPQTASPPSAPSAERPRVPSYMPDLPEPRGPLDEYWARQRPTREYASIKPAWESSMDAFFDETLPRASSWLTVRLQQNPFLYAPLVIGSLFTLYFSFVGLALIAGFFRQWRASVRMNTEWKLTQAEHQKQMRGIMADVAQHKQSKLRFEISYYDVAIPPPNRPPLPRPTDLS
jgi:hypothetical protein